MRCNGAILLAGALALLPVPSLADTVSIGYLSFDLLIPGAPGMPGVNTFTIGNLTGDPSSGGNAVPPDFPVLTSLTFQNSSLELDFGGSPLIFNLGDIGPGFFSPNVLEFPDSTAFNSAIFSATLGNTLLQLDGGGNIQACSNHISVLLLPSVGNSLVAGTDLVVIGASPVPEPDSGFLFGVPALGLLLWKRVLPRTLRRNIVN